MSKVNLAQPPESLKSIATFIQRAVEFERKDPLVAWYCRSYAADIAVKVFKQVEDPKQKAEARAWTIALMDKVEADQKSLENMPKAEGKLYMESKAMELFQKADDAERSGRKDEVVAKIFYASSVLMEVCRYFCEQNAELPEDILEKAKYAQFKAAEIRKLLKNPQVPVSPDVASADSNPQLSSSAPAEAPSAPVVSHSPPSIASPVSPPSFNALSPPPKPQPPQQQQHHHVASPPAVQSQSASAANNNTLPLPSAAGFHAVSSGSQARTSASQIDNILEAQKAAKYAVSALQFQDINTAITNLRKALDILEASR